MIFILKFSLTNFQRRSHNILNNMNVSILAIDIWDLSLIFPYSYISQIRPGWISSTYFKDERIQLKSQNGEDPDFANRHFLQRVLGIFTRQYFCGNFLAIFFPRLIFPVTFFSRDLFSRQFFSNFRVKMDRDKKSR